MKSIIKKTIEQATSIQLSDGWLMQPKYTCNWRAMLPQQIENPSREEFITGAERAWSQQASLDYILIGVS